MRFGAWTIAGSVLFTTLLSGCFERRLKAAVPCTRSRVGNTVTVTSVDKVDLLFMIDNSGSMKEEQESLREELPNLVQALASGDQDRDGEQDFTPVRSLHVGIVTSDMGSNGYVGPNARGCSDAGQTGGNGSDFGDDGLLQNTATGTGCTGRDFPRVFEFNMGDSAAMFAADVGCVSNLGTNGCAIEQQLEAALKAVSPSRETPVPWTVDGYEPPSFHANTGGHGGENDGFVREDSALAIVLVTDEEDCSLPNADLFDNAIWGDPGQGGVPVGLRCADPDDDVPDFEPTWPVARYINGGGSGRGGFLGLRRNPALLIFAGIVGIPDDLRGDNFDAMLMDPRLMYANNHDPRDPGLVTSCDTANGKADPPRRIIQVAQGLQAAGAAATIQSICNDDFGPALDVVINLLANALRGACLPRDLNPDAEGLVDCNVFEVLPAGMRCDLPGRTANGSINDDGVQREICAVTQVSRAQADSMMPGWLYEQGADPWQPTADNDIRSICGAEGQRIRFANIDTITGSEIRLECLQRVTPPEGTVDLGTFCDPRGSDICGGPMAARPGMVCDVVERVCAIGCSGTTQDEGTARCTEAGLLGTVCDVRPLSEVVTADALGRIPGVDPSQPHNVCVSPTCL